MRKVDPYMDYISTAPQYLRIRRPTQLRKIGIIIADSGAFYTLMVFITFVLAVVRSNGSGVAAGIVSDPLVTLCRTETNGWTMARSLMDLDTAICGDHAQYHFITAHRP